MNFQIKALMDGRMVGLAVIEVTSFPSLDGNSLENERQLQQIYQHFSSVVQEFYRIGQDVNAFIELLWITDRAAKQTFRSRVRLFCVVRKIGANADATRLAVEQLANLFIASFSSKQFCVNANNDSFDQYLKLISQTDSSCLYSVIKHERIAGNATSIYPYYYSDIIPTDNSENFTALVAALSQMENCAVSFQISPARFSRQEQVYLNEVTGELGRITSGIMMGREIYQDLTAKEPYVVLSAYQGKINAPLFNYNMLVFGNRQDCNTLVSKVVSLLQAGQKRIMSPDFTSIDLTAEKVNLSTQYMNYPWNINNRLTYHYRNSQLFDRVPMAKALFKLPFIVTAEEAATFFRLPLREKNMPALTENQTGLSTEMFDESVISENKIEFGRLMSNDFSNVYIGCPEKAFTRHALIVGTPGSGKTTFSMNLLLQFYKRNIPFLVIEPTKHEYRALLDAVPDMQVFTPGKNDVSPFIINPFIPPKGIKLEHYVPSLASAFQAAFSMQQPLDMLFLRAIRICYAEYGWKDYSTADDGDVTHFGMYDFIRVFKKLVEETNYEAKVKGNLQSAGVLRLMNLVEQNSNIYDSIHTVPIEDLLMRPTILELNAIENAEQKSLLMALILINICTFTKQNHKSEGRLQNIILIDEAHVLFGAKQVGEGEANPISSTTKALQDMVAEIRSYGTGIIIADQNPSRIGREIMACTDIKVAFRLVEESERKLFAGSIDLSSASLQKIARLGDGEAFFYFGKLNEPQLIQTPDVRAVEGIRLDVPDEEISTKMTYWDSRQSALVPFSECRLSKACGDLCSFKLRADAAHYAIRFMQEYGKRITDIKVLRQYILLAEEWLTAKQGLDASTLDERLTNCLKIRLLRKTMIEKDFLLSIKMTEKLLESTLR